MDASVIVKTEDICRCCVENDAENAILRSLFDFLDLSLSCEVQRIQIGQLLESAVPQLPKIEINDKLPKKICSFCVEQLLCFYKFQKTCLASDQRLRADLGDQFQTPLIKTEAVFKIDVDVTEEGANIIKLESNDQVATSFTEEAVENTEKTNEVILTSKARQKKKVLNCFFCDNGFYSKLQLQKHMKNVHNIDTREKVPSINEHKCDKCQLTFISQGSLQEHVCKEVKNDVPLTLLDNNQHIKMLNQDELLNSHVKLESDEISNSVKNQIEIQFTTQNVKAYDGIIEKNFKKKKCNPVERADRELVEKLLQETYAVRERGRPKEVSNKKVACVICSQVLVRKSNLIHHLLTRHGIDMRAKAAENNANERANWACDVCDEDFNDFSSLAVHKVAHVNKWKYRCKYCKRYFFAADSLRIHLRVHTGKQPYKCKYCPKKYNKRNNLTVHLRKHLGEHVYKCDLCSARFSKFNEFRAHTNSHGADKGGNNIKLEPVA